MFLDDELLKICEDAITTTPQDIQELNKTLCGKCEDYYRKKINKNMTPKEVKVILDRTFNLFDSFVRMALKSNISQLKILGELFKEFTFKKQFLSNDEMNKVYSKL